MTEMNLPEPLEGKTSGEEMKFEPIRLSYLSAEAVAKDIAAKLSGSVKDKTVVIMGTSLLVDFTNLASTLTTLEGLKQDYHAVSSCSSAMTSTGKPPAAARVDSLVAAPLSVAAAATQVLGLISLFREDVEYKGVETVVDPLSFEIVLASALKAVGAEMVIVPDLFATSPRFIVDDGLRERIKDVHQAKGVAWEAITPAISEILQLEAGLELALSGGDKAEVQRIRADLTIRRESIDPISERLSEVDRQLTELENMLERAIEGQAVTRLGRLIRAEAILERGNQEGHESVFVHAKIVASGGHQRIGRHLFRMLFLGDGISFTGGVVARWSTLSPRGEFCQGGISHSSFFSRLGKRPACLDSRN